MPKVRAIYRLLLNPDKPEELYRPVKALLIVLLFVGFMFAFMGTVALLVYNMQFQIKYPLSKRNMDNGFCI